MFAVDVLLLILVLSFAPLAGRMHLRKARSSPVRLWDRFAAHRRLAVVAVGMSAFVGSALLSWAIGVHEPSIHDEFSYLLGADTFAQGRWTNPTHPLWEHFDTFHVLQRPTYQTKFPPAQSLFLAFGKRLGHPLIGVWLGMGLCCGAICWMLQAWVPPRWALLGAMFAAVRLVSMSTDFNWSQSYWGGGVAAFGGALVFGAVRRLVKDHSTSASIALAIGLLVLANSRPYEGLMAALPVAVLLLGWIARKSRPSIGILVPHVGLPLLLILAPGFGLMAYYNYRVTGSPLIMPARLHQDHYDMAPKFYWQPVRPEPTYPAPELKKIHVDWEYRDLYLNASFVRTGLGSLWDVFRFFLGLLLWLPLLFLPFIFRNVWMRFALIALAIEFAALSMEIFFFPHYAAPITCLIYLLVIQSYRRMRLFRRSTSHYGRGVARLLTVALLVSCACFLTWGTRLSPQVWAGHLNPNSFNRQRASIIKELESQGGKHLIRVRYSPNHSVSFEWVYNDADIDRARVVWARELDAERDRQLLDYYSDRTIWILEADKSPLRLELVRLPHVPDHASGGSE